MCVSAIATTPEAIINRTNELYNKLSGVEVHFKADITTDKSGSTHNFDGTIIFSGDKFVLHSTDMHVWYDGVTQWNYKPKNNEVYVSRPEKSEMQKINPFMLLKDYKKDWKAALTGESTSINARQAYDIALTPKHKDDIEKIVLQIEKTSSMPTRITLYMLNETCNTITIKNITEKKTAPEEFVFPSEKYRDVDIIDL
jgi:outer membrane lipoprotein-sorting protein